MKKIFSILLLFIAVLSLGSCGGFIADESLVIQSITSETLDDGSTKIIITYTDETIKPVEFTIPKGNDGENGKNGNGIKGISYELSDDGLYTNVTIDFTIEGSKPETIKVRSGISIANITSKINSDGNTEFEIEYTDGTKSDPIVVPKGEKGDPGTALIEYTYVTNEDGSQDLVFKYNDGTEYPVYIPAPQKGEKGDAGISIIGVGSNETDTDYQIIIVYSEGEPSVISFKKPVTPKDWHYGNDIPSGDLGRDGDYYFDIIHDIIYLKKDGSWKDIVTFKNENQTFKVNFNLNDDDGYTYDNGEKVEAKLPDNYGTQYNITRGENFKSSGYEVPLPTRDGFEFAGWYTSKNPNITNGLFTDLTVVTCEITLYAKWVLEE